MRSHISKSDELSETLKRIEEKIDLLVDKTKMKRQAEKREGAMRPGGALDIVTLLSLPDHLRKSAMTIMRLGRAMAEDVARETGRARAIESAYLNQLARMGHVKKEKEGRRVYFSVEGNQANVEYLLKEKVATVVG
jgi:DNA-binding transcriptional ArsR family regulator